ncbi:hypothetical protein GQ472_02570 [archaeon]|nr:hypothetical protein [archaeon]
METEIEKLKTELLDEEIKLNKHYQKKDEIQAKITKVFRENIYLTLDDLKDAKNIMGLGSSFELAAIERIDTLDIKKLIIKSMLKDFIPEHKNCTALIKDYFRGLDKQECIDNITLFENRFNKIVEYRLKDVTDFIKNHIGADPKKYFKEL